jgi:hypothetical protein
MSNKVIYAIYNDDDILMDAVKNQSSSSSYWRSFYTFSCSRIDKAMGLDLQD